MGLSLGSPTQFQPPVTALGRNNRRRNWVISRSKTFPAETAASPSLGLSMFNPAPPLLCQLHLLLSRGEEDELFPSQ